MSKSRLKSAKAAPKQDHRRQNARSYVRPADPSPVLPLATAPDPQLPPSSEVARRVILPKNSVIRKKAMAIIAMRIAGKSNDEIAAALEISPASVRQYMWLAGKNGWLAKGKFADPNDRIDYEIAHKVVRNLDEMLDSDDPTVRHEATMETAKGTLFKKYAEGTAAAPPSMILAVRIENVAGANTEVREGTTGGKMRWVEGEVVDASALGLAQR